MDLKILNLIYNAYECSDGRIHEQAEEFSEKYIKPFAKQDLQEATKMEQMFNGALAEADAQAFKDGFKVCMHFIIYCLKDDL